MITIINPCTTIIINNQTGWGTITFYLAKIPLISSNASARSGTAAKAKCPKPVIWTDTVGSIGKDREKDDVPRKHGVYNPLSGRMIPNFHPSKSRRMQTSLISSKRLTRPRFSRPCRPWSCTIHDSSDSSRPCCDRAWALHRLCVPRVVPRRRQTRAFCRAHASLREHDDL